MNQNNFGLNNPQPNSYNTQSYQKQQQYNTQMPQYTVNVNSMSVPSYQPSYQYEQRKLSPQPTSNGFLQHQQSQLQAKQKMKMNSSKSTGGFTSLSSLARKVNDPIAENKIFDFPTNNNNNLGGGDRYNTMINKIAGNGSKDYKMANSAIFPTNQSQFQWNKLPTFNLAPKTVQQNNQPGISVASNQNKGTELKSGSLTARQKRQNELMQIKKQLDQLNKKMMANNQKKMNAPNNNNTQNELRPNKPAVISHSVIFDNSGYNSSFDNKFNESKQPSQTNNTLDFMYAQKKNNQTVKKIEDISQKKVTFEPCGPKNIYDMPYQGINYSKPYQFQKKSQQAYNKPKPSYNYEINLPKKQPQTSYNYGGAYLPQTQPQKTPSYQPSYQNNNAYNNISNNQFDKNNYIYNNKTDNNYNYNTNILTKQVKPSENYQSYKPYQNNASSSTTTSNNATEAGGFKKKKGPTMPQPFQSKQIDMNKSIYEPETSNTSKINPSSHSSIKRTQSLSMEDPMQQIKQLKKFKYSDFAVGKKMGKGQFGEVLLVRHKETGWVCGLKVMNKKDIKDQDYAGQIARQLSIQFYLQHRNISQLYGYFQDEKNFYLLIEFCTGGQLLQKLKVQRRMNERDVSLIIRQVCQGVDYIHKQQIIHRDIKPQNILFNFGIVKICDFGWAVYRDFGMRKTASGSPLYYPPQIVKGELYDDKIDNWCIGMMAYQCIIGKIPFKVYTQMDLGRIVSDQITFPSWVDVTEQAQDFILKTLKKTGQERMQIKQMLKHPFITKHQQKQLSSNIIQQFRRVIG